MDTKKTLSWTLLIALSLSPIIPWYFGPTAQHLNSYADWTHAIGQLAGLIGMTMFALTFLLSTRIRFLEDLFGGLDKVYIVHGILGGTALVLILFHPIFLVLKYFPTDAALAAKYLVPGGAFSVDLGIYAFLGMIALIMLTLYSKIKYNRWKFSHKFLGAVFIFAAMHIFLIRETIARDIIFEGYYLYAAIVTFIGLFGFLWSLFLKDRESKTATYRIDSIARKKGEVHDITLSPIHKPLTYKAGQFVFLRFYNHRLGRESHPFSIASKSNNPHLRIVVKNLGDFTSSLGELNTGDTVLVEGPYGRFNFKRHDVDQIWIAAGIGITPFIGMAEDTLSDRRFSKTDLFYSVRGEEDLVAMDTFSRVERESKKRFRVFPWISNKDGRISGEAILHKSGSLYGKEVFICGPTAFKEALKESLTRLGVRKENIFEEDFEFRK